MRHGGNPINSPMTPETDMKKRIVIRAFTLRRDVAAAAVLAKLLERMNCEVVIASARNFRRTLKLWKPHAVLVNTVSEVEACIELAPDALCVQWPGEGSEALRTSSAWYYEQRPELYEHTDLILHWGAFNAGHFDEMFPGQKHEKLVQCGNPRLDLIKFNPDLVGLRANSNSVGIVGRFNSINHHDGRPTLFSVRRPANIEGVINQIHGFVAVMSVIHHLVENTEYDISIRPHPAEAPQSYTKYVKPIAPDRIHVDESLDFGAWAASQRFIAAPSSTTFLETYLQRIPFVNLDRITNSEAFIKSIQPFTVLAMKIGETPETFEHLYEFMQGDIELPEPDPEVDDHLDVAHDWFTSESAIKRNADAILKGIEQKNPKVGASVPKPVLAAIDEISFRRAMRKSELHANFDYKANYHPIPNYYDEIVENILNGRLSSTYTDRPTPVRATSVAD